MEASECLRIRDKDDPPHMVNIDVIDKKSMQDFIDQFKDSDGTELCSLTSLVWKLGYVKNPTSDPSKVLDDMLHHWSLVGNQGVLPMDGVLFHCSLHQVGNCGWSE